MQYTPFASPSQHANPVDGSASKSDSDEDLRSDGSGDCIPASSSTLLPSSPAQHGFIDDTLLNDNTVEPCAAEIKSSIYAPEAQTNGRSRLSEELEHWFSMQGIQQAQGEYNEASNSVPQSSGRGSNIDADTARSTSVPLDDSCSMDSDKARHSEEMRGACSGDLDSRDEKQSFSDQLTRLLLNVLAEQAQESQEGSAAVDDRCTPTTSSASMSAILDDGQPLDALFAHAMVLPAADASDAYAADISTFGTNSTSFASLSASVCTAVSESCSSSFSSSSDYLSDYAIQSPTRDPRRFVYNPETGSQTISPSSSSDGSFDENIPGYHVFPVADTATSVHTPTLQHLPSGTPLAPKKVQHRIYAPPTNANILPVSSRPTRKRSRSQSMVLDDPPVQDKVAQDGIEQQPQRELSTSQEREQNPGELTRKETLRERSDSLAKRRKLSMAAGPTEACKQNSHMPTKTLASFRRAASMRSEVEVFNALDEQDVEMAEVAETQEAGTKIERSASIQVLHPSTHLVKCPGTPRPDAVPQADMNFECFAPTRPVTPTPRKKYHNVTPSDSPLPILAPPPFEFIPRPPASKQEEAELRLRRLQEKETEQRVEDDLVTFTLTRVNDGASPGSANQNTPTRTTENARETSGEECFEDIQIVLGIDEEFRADIVEWILDVEPPNIRNKPLICANLRAQLADCPDTRWHAAHLLTRYFLRVGTSPNSPPVTATRKNEAQPSLRGESLSEREAVAWDCAVACLASAVKLHRDFLEPLFPVIVNEYLLIASHVMTYKDLEAAQREVLQAFSFCLGTSTPGAYMEEIRNALPGLRTFVDRHANWDVVTAETWEVLYDSLIDQDYLRYPVYLLTGCSLIFGIMESITLKLKAEHATTLHSLATGKIKPPRGRNRLGRCDCNKFRRKARKAVRAIERDVRELLGVSENAWNGCKAWLNELIECQYKD
ncbi:hypothetical protein NM688_g5178 [Phlebia brevispora]|uniref:Uncharacterized protein n=1 Tax=Phlebia brevispora TaxID=194682 RepID=A0ACC1SZW7_9APHY|nr:hypothetical protein NM688_g5178 [Phlebia brevispora]